MRAGGPRTHAERLDRASSRPPATPARRGVSRASIYAARVAARRLIIFMLALLVLSSVAAALVPIDRETLRDTSTTAPSPSSEPTGRLVEAEVDADAEQPQRIGIRLGDSLTLTVTASSAGLVEVVGLGLTEDVDPDAPAVFDLRPFERGSYPVRLAGERRIALIEVGPRRPPGS